MRLVGNVEITSAEQALRRSKDGLYGRVKLRDQAWDVAFHSSLERDFALMCDFAREVTLLRSQPFTFSFDDKVPGKRRRYTPDFLVETNSQRGTRYSYLIEIKPQAEYDRIYSQDPEGQDARKHIAAQVWCRAQPAMEMAVITERWLHSRGVMNVRLIQAASTYEINQPLRAAMLNEIKTNTRVTLQALIGVGERLGIGRPAVVSSILRLCDEDLCQFDIARPLDGETIFYEGRRQRIFRI